MHYYYQGPNNWSGSKNVWNLIIEVGGSGKHKRIGMICVLLIDKSKQWKTKH